MRDEAEKRLGHLYPKAYVGGMDCTVIAWIWARTVTCPNPACAGTMPLVNKFWLGKKKGKERYVIPIPDGKRVRFEIGGPSGIPRDGTVGRTGAECVLCGTPVPLAYIREEGRAGRMSAQLMAIAAEGPRQRYYIAPNEEHEKAAEVPPPSDIPEENLAAYPGRMNTVVYGLTRFSDLFTNRQLTMVTTLSKLVREARSHALAGGATTGYAEAVATYLAFIVSRVADRNSSICTWDASPKMESLRNTFARQAIPMSWDFGEGYALGNGSGNISDAASWIADVIDGLPAGLDANAEQVDAACRSYDQMLVATDPPYYDNIIYANLSDFFYVWLRRSLGAIYPDLLATMVTPKEDELIANPYLHKEADKFFENGFSNVFHRIRKGVSSELPITVFYAFKQSESDDSGGHASTGWETLLEGMISSGWAVTGTWPIRTELSNRPMSQGMNALASSIALACRPRHADAGFTDRRGLINALREEFPDALRKMEQGKVAPVDLRQAAIGPGMAIFSRYARVNEPDGTPMRVRAALSLINQVLDEKLSQLEGSVSPDTRFAVEWFKQYGFDQGPFGTAETLSKGIDTSIDGLVRAGVVKSAAGKVKLLSVRDIPDFYNPENDERTSEWEICLHLAKALQDRGTDDAARLMAAARRVPTVDLDDVKELAYLLYSIAEKKGWAETALLFNNMGTLWTDLEKLAQKAGAETGGQSAFTLEFGSDDDGDE